MVVRLYKTPTLSLREKRHRLVPSIEALTGERNKIKNAIYFKLSKKPPRVVFLLSTGRGCYYLNSWYASISMNTRTLRVTDHHWWDALHLPSCLCKAMLVLSLSGQLIALPVVKYRQIVADKSRPERADLFRCFPRYCLFSIVAVYFAVGIIRLLSVIFMTHPGISPIPFLDWWWTGFAKLIRG